MTVTALDVLRAVRVCGLSDRASEGSEHAWSAQCPCCLARAHGRRTLRVVEVYRDGPARVSCSSGCERDAILTALGLAVGAGDAVEDDRPGRRPRLRLLDIERMVASEPPPVPWIAEPLLARGAVTMLVGREGQGKSMLALALAAAIGHGAEVAGIACRSGRVLVIDAENGEAEAHRRVRGLGVKAGALVYAEADGFDLRGDLGEVEALLAAHRPDVLVLDSLRSLAPGLDENDSGPVEAVLGPLRGLSRRQRCATLVLHHAGKASNAYRGSTAIGAAVELGFTLARVGEDPCRRTLTCWKSRLAPEPAARTLSLEARAGRVAITVAEPDEPSGGSRTDELADRLAALVAARGPLPWGELAALAGEGAESGTAKRARRRAIEDGRIVPEGRGRYGPPQRSTVQPAPVGGVDGRPVASDGGTGA